MKVVNPEAPTLLQLVSCGLDVIQGADKAGQEATDWKSAKVIYVFHSSFKQCPAKRNDFLLSNELHESREKKETNNLFPLKYCGHRKMERLCLD